MAETIKPCAECAGDKTIKSKGVCSECGAVHEHEIACPYCRGTGEDLRGKRTCDHGLVRDCPTCAHHVTVGTARALAAAAVPAVAEE